MKKNFSHINVSNVYTDNRSRTLVSNAELFKSFQVMTNQCLYKKSTTTSEAQLKKAQHFP